jgi:peptidoglycan/LPS O-acetylase OafA/YrhL
MLSPQLAVSRNPSRPSGTSYIPTLDGWRAVAIAAVLFCHGLDQAKYPFAMPLGLAGVLLFFSISGFLITCRLIEERALTGTVSFRKFYVRRAFRILPPAVFYLAVIAALGLVGVIPFSGIDLAKALLFVRNYTFLDLGNPASWYSVHFWSLSVEEHFYLVWPAVLVLVWVRRGRWTAFTVAVVLAVATVLWRTADEKFHFVIRFFDAPYLVQNMGRTDYVADVLLWGCALALWLGPRSPGMSWRRYLSRGYTTLFATFLIAFIAYDFFGKGLSHGRDLVYVLMALLIGATVTDPESLLSRMLELAPLRWIGRLSYSLYLWQELFFHVDGAPLWFQRFPVNVGLIFACAWLSYTFVERPLVRLGHRVARPVQLGHRDDLKVAGTAVARA